MHLFHWPIIISILCSSITFHSCSRSYDSKNTVTGCNLVFLQSYAGKYPADVGLFENMLFKQRLYNLLGKTRFNFLSETWAVETPMEISENTFVAEGCQAHNCGFTNFIIVVDFSTNVMYAGIREYSSVEIFSEDTTVSQKIKIWAK